MKGTARYGGRCGRPAGKRLSGHRPGHGSRDDNDATQYVDASQLQVAVEIQEGDQNAAANDGSEASNELSIDQSQYNAGLGDIFFD